MTDQTSLERRRRQIRDHMLPRALARIGREAIAAHVQLPQFGELVASLALIEADLLALSKEGAPTQDEIEQYYVLRRRRRLGYAEFGEAVLHQMPSEALPNSFEEAIQSYRRLERELDSIETDLRPSARKKHKKPKPPERASDKLAPEPHAPLYDSLDEEPLLTVDQSPPPTPTPFKIQDPPDFGEPLDIPHTKDRTPLYKRAWYKLSDTWDTIQPYYGMVTLSLVLCLMVVFGFQGIRLKLDELELHDQSAQRAEDEAADSASAGTLVANDPSAMDSAGNRIGLPHIVGIALLVVSLAAYWGLWRRGRTGQRNAVLSASTTLVNLDDEAEQLDTGGNLRVYDPTETHRRKGTDWKRPVGITATPLADAERSEDLSPEVQQVDRGAMVRWVLPVVILLNVVLFLFYRADPESKAVNVEEAALAPSDTLAPRAPNEIGSESEISEIIEQRPGAIDETTRTLEVQVHLSHPLLTSVSRPERISMYAMDAPTSLYFSDTVSARRRPIDGIPTLYALEAGRVHSAPQRTEGLLDMLAANAEDLRAYSLITTLCLSTDLPRPAMEMRNLECVAVFRVETSVGSGTTSPLLAEPGNLTTSAELVRWFGAATERQSWSPDLRSRFGIERPVEWWGNTGVVTDEMGSITHLLVRTDVTSLRTRPTMQ